MIVAIHKAVIIAHIISSRVATPRYELRPGGEIGCTVSQAALLQTWIEVHAAEILSLAQQRTVVTEYSRYNV